MKRVRSAAEPRAPATSAQTAAGALRPRPEKRRAGAAQPGPGEAMRKPPGFVPGVAGPVDQMEPVARALALVMKRARLKVGMPLAELAGRAHVDPAGWRRFEECERRSSVDMLARGLRVLGLDPVEVMREALAEVAKEAGAGSQADNCPLDEASGAGCNRAHERAESRPVPHRPRGR